ncbi:MAG: hypothetical protein QOJ64_646 [Acidobacteriota bacterium]|nr:hypothetical protein [Acidobacteriota bacterium]
MPEAVIDCSQLNSNSRRWLSHVRDARIKLCGADATVGDF